MLNVKCHAWEQSGHAIWALTNQNDQVRLVLSTEVTLHIKSQFITWFKPSSSNWVGTDVWGPSSNWAQQGLNGVLKIKVL